MGGPMSVNDTDKYNFLTPEIKLIERMLADKKPVLGICLGAQLMAKALGARIYPNAHRELGWHDIQLTDAAVSDPLFAVQANTMRVFHWHGETFNLPPGAVHLAKSDRCANQAFRWGGNSYGFQFHFEVTPAMVSEWCSSAEGQADVIAAGETVADVLAKTPAAYQALEPVAQTIFNRYVQLATKTAPSLV
jgi:GMP synthase (glutamine-hydrolysing)